jgi:mercuric ion transport protein
MGRILSTVDKLGVSGVIVAALSCAVCFPALGSLAAALGLGFLSQFEGIAITLLLPLFAVIALMVNAYAWFKGRAHWRGLLSICGPTLILITLYFLWHFSWSITLFYCALILMVCVSIGDFVWPVRPRCSQRQVGK